MTLLLSLPDKAIDVLPPEIINPRPYFNKGVKLNP